MIVKKLNGILCFGFCLVTVLSFGQKTVDIKLDPKRISKELSCFDIQLRSPHGEEILLAGQNYRLFYDASKVKVKKESIKSLLDPKAYTPIDVISTELNNIGFLSLSLDGREINDKVEKLSTSGTWHASAYVCFENIAKKDFDLTWAHKDRTFQFASASVAMSEWINPYQQQILEINEVEDYSSANSTLLQLTDEVHVKLYPNPVADFVNVELSNQMYESSQIVIKDIIGREVVYDQVAGKNKMTYDLTNWPEGIYRLEVLNRDGMLIYTDQVVKSAH